MQVWEIWHKASRGPGTTLNMHLDPLCQLEGIELHNEEVKRTAQQSGQTPVAHPSFRRRRPFRRVSRAPGLPDIEE